VQVWPTANCCAVELQVTARPVPLGRGHVVVELSGVHWSDADHVPPLLQINVLGDSEPEYPGKQETTQRPLTGVCAEHNDVFTPTVVGIVQLLLGATAPELHNLLSQIGNAVGQAEQEGPYVAYT